MNNIQQKLQNIDEAELKKCQEDPVYFWNKYVRKEGTPELTYERYEAMRLAALIPFKFRRSPIFIKPLLPSVCFKKK